MIDTLTWGTVISALVGGSDNAAAQDAVTRLVACVRQRFEYEPDTSGALVRARKRPDDHAALRTLDRHLDALASRDTGFRQVLLDWQYEYADRAVTRQTLGHTEVHGSTIQVGGDNHGGICIGADRPQRS